MFTPAEELSVFDSLLRKTLNASAGPAELLNSIATGSYSCDFANAVWYLDLPLFDQVAESPSVDAVDSGSSVLAGVRDNWKLRVSEIENYLGRQN